MAEALEQSMIADLAIDHFEAAMKYLRVMPNDEAKLAALLRVAEALRQNY